MKISMLKSYHVQNIIEDALQQLDGVLSDPDENDECTLSEATVEDKGNGELILSFKEYMLSNAESDVYRIKIDRIG